MKRLLLLLLVMAGLGVAEWRGDTMRVPIVSAEIDTTDEALQNYVANHAVEGGGPAFPVGAVYLNVTGTSPATELGYGTWSRIAEGQFLVGQTAEDEDFDTAEETGGVKTHTHDSHTTGNARSGTGATMLSGPETHSTASHVPPYFVIYVWKRTE